MSTKTKAAKTVPIKKAAAKRVTGQKAEKVVETDGAEWARVDRLYDTPQKQWGVEQWKTLATYLIEAYARVVAKLGEANALTERALDTAKEAIAENKRLAAHSKLLRLLVQGIDAGTLSIVERPARKKAGRKPKRTPEQQRKRDEGLVVLAARRSPREVALRLARLEVNGQSTERSVAKIERRAKTLANEISEARTRVKANVMAEMGALAAHKTISDLKLIKPRKRSPKNSK